MKKLNRALLVFGMLISSFVFAYVNTSISYEDLSINEVPILGGSPVKTIQVTIT